MPRGRFLPSFFCTAGEQGRGRSSKDCSGSGREIENRPRVAGDQQGLQPLSQTRTGGMEVDSTKIEREEKHLTASGFFRPTAAFPRPYADTCSARFLFLFCPRNCRAAWRTRRQNRNGTTSSATSTPLRKRRLRPVRRASSCAARPEERPEPSCEAWGLRLPPVIRREDGRDFIERQKSADRPAALIACRRKKRFVVPRRFFCPPNFL